jgi:hypothetical protein
MIAMTSPTGRAKSIFLMAGVGMLLAAMLLASGLPAATTRASAADFVAAGIGDWQQSASAGFGVGSASFMADPIAEYNGSLYAGVSNQSGAQLRVRSGGVWSAVNTGLTNITYDMAILSMRVFGGALYVGTFNLASGCEIWKYDGAIWTKLVGVGGTQKTGGFGSTENVAALSMEVHAGKLYVGTLNLYFSGLSIASNGGEVWSYDGVATWARDYSSGFGSTSNIGVASLKEYSGSLYAGTMTAATSFGLDVLSGSASIGLTSLGCQLWRQGSGVWTKLADNGLGQPTNMAAMCMEVYGGNLWVGTLGADITINVNFSTLTVTGATWESHGLCLYSYNGANLVPRIQNGFESTNEVGALSMSTCTAGGQQLLVVGAGRTGGGGGATDMTSMLRAYDGSNWYQAASDGFGNAKNMGVMSMLFTGGTLWAGTLNADQGCEIWSVTPNQPTEPLVTNTFYFAEGYTGSNFQEYICLGNPTPQSATAIITYLYKDGTTKSDQITIPADSRATVNVNARAGPGQDVSARVDSDQKVIAERPMYFKYNNMWTGGHDAVGATRLSNQWYFAEGYTGPGFEEWICVLNPGDAQADLTFYFQTQEAGEKKIEGLCVPPHSRGSFKANDLLGGKSYQTSLRLDSNQSIVAERPMYFDYAGTGNWHWTGGHCVMGTHVLEKQYYFAEGTTRSGFEEWLTLQNPKSAPITVNAIYQVGPGQGGPVSKSYDVPALGRMTVYVPGNDGAGPGKDVSVYLSSASAFLAERPMYFRYSFDGLTATGGHCVIGAASPAPEWFLAEGYTGSGFSQWLCIQNPGDSDASVEVTYYTQEKGALSAKIEPIPARTRATLMVNQHAGPNYSLSTRVKVLSGSGVVVERPMYFIYNGWDGGHDVVGYVPAAD